MEQNVIKICQMELGSFFKKMNYHIQKYDLKTCCTFQSSFCIQCATNLLFRGGTNLTAQTTNEDLINRVATGLKPVGTIVLRNLDEKIDYPENVVELCRTTNKWNVAVAVFSAVPNTKLSELVDLEVLKTILKKTYVDATVRDLASDPKFINEEFDYVLLGLLYGYPLWSSISFMV